ncbi:16529_t:CDS:2, partial [Racocetra fulgida]
STVASYDDPITIELMAQDTIELIKHLGIKRFNLCGGTDIKSYETAEQLYKLPKMDHPKTIQEQKDMLLKSEKSLADYLLKHPDKFNKIAEIILSTNANRPFEIFTIKQSDLVSRLQEIKVPTLIVHGEADEIVPIEDGELLDREIPNTQFHRIPEENEVKKNFKALLYKIFECSAPGSFGSDLKSTVASDDDPIIELMEQDTIELIRLLGIKRFNLLGRHMGGKRLKEIKVLTLIIHGEVCKIVLIEETEFLDHEIHNTKFCKIPK